jgi:1-acyl-sn-glycerol-3-phosphate acyltransferase
MAIEKADGAERLLALIAQLSPAGGGAFNRDTVLSDVGFDSLAFAELSSAVHQDLGIDLTDAGVCRARTAGDLVELVDRVSATRRAAGRSLYPQGMGRTQRLAKTIAGPILRWWFEMEVRGAEVMPDHGPLILCMNHESMLDIPLIVIASPRPVTFMAKRELFAKRGWARFFHELGGFSVDRDAFDLPAIAISLEVIRTGGVLGMYPEGTRVAGKMLPFLPGAAWLALGTGTPLMPAAIDGTGAAMPKEERRLVPRRIPVSITFAAPIAVEKIEEPGERRRQALRLTEEVRSTVGDLLGR